VTFRLESVQRAAAAGDGNSAGSALVAIVGSDYGGVQQQRHIDQVVVNHGTRPLDELYFALKAKSTNAGALDYDALIAGHPQPGLNAAAGGFQLFRIGDAVAARNTHAAVYDALRLMKDV